MLQETGIHLPSMTALLAFESVGRLESVTAAARELGRTQSAISRQISTLEEQLGVRLFDRVKQKLLLTNQGNRYHNDVRRILDELMTCTASLSPQRKTRRSLCLSVGSSFSDRWLVRRLPRFGELHPDIDISISIARNLSDLEMERVDLLIGSRLDLRIDTRREVLITERLVLVGTTTRAAALEEDTPILQHALRKGDWPQYMAERRGNAALPTSSLAFDRFGAIIQAASLGLGVALVPDFMVEEELESGQLCRLDPEPMVTGKSYDLEFPIKRNLNKAVNDFVSWIREEAAPIESQMQAS